MSSSNNSNSNQPVVPSAREALNKFKMEAAQSEKYMYLVGDRTRRSIERADRQFANNASGKQESLSAYGRST